nr:MAG TPA: hypothetical protein [Caudoviricetes sp.]
MFLVKKIKKYFTFLKKILDNFLIKCYNIFRQ